MTAVAVAPAPNADGRERLTALWAEERTLAFAPPPLLTVSQWADQCRVVPSYSAEPGRWVTEKTPYLREIMDCFSDAAVNRVVFMKCSRIGATEAGINVIGYFIAQDPSPIFIVQPTVDDAKDFSKEQLTPTIEETDALRGRVSEASSRDSGNTLLAKLFPGGALYLVGANSPRGFRRRTARVVVLEEVDGYPPSAGTEGDQIKLAERRADTFQHRAKVYINSTPTLKGFSRIEDQFVRSDQRRYFVACPDCGHEQTLVWQNLKWDDGRPDTAAYACAGCGVLIPEREKFGMVAGGHWVKTAPEWSTAGFHISALYSPWVAWRKLAEEWIDAQGDLAKLQVFVNTALGETWEDRGGGLDPRVLESRREAYGAEVPNQVGLLTCGVDVQHDRLEYIVRGWGHAEESWLIAHGVVLGDTGKPDVWADFERERAREYRNAAGNALKIAVTCVDTGDGNNVDAAYRYCKPRYGLRVYATKGSSRPGAPLLPRRPTTNNKGKVRLFLIGTDTAKDEIYSRLKLSIPGPRYMHVPDWISDDYFAQVTSEKVVRENVNGRWVKRYKLPPKARNEALDCEVLAFAAMRLAPWKPAQFAGLAARAATPQAPQEPAPAESPEEPVQTLEQVVQASRPPRGRRRSGYIDGWRR